MRSLDCKWRLLKVKGEKMPGDLKTHSFQKEIIRRYFIGKLEFNLNFEEG